MKRGSSTKNIAFTMAAFVGIALTAVAQDDDPVILNGRVMDPETSFDGVRNVGVKDGEIAAITEDTITGKEIIDAKGLVVAPGSSGMAGFPS